MTHDNQTPINVRECTHVGAQVRDVRKTIDVFSKLFGWGSWENRRLKTERKAIDKNGKQFTYNSTGAFVRLGHVVLDITETHGEDCRTEWVAHTGGGLHHLSFEADDLEDVVAKLEKLRIPILESAKLEDGKYMFVYIDIEGIVIEILRKGLEAAHRPSPVLPEWK